MAHLLARVFAAAGAEKIERIGPGAEVGISIPKILRVSVNSRRGPALSWQDLLGAAYWRPQCLKVGGRLVLVGLAWGGNRGGVGLILNQRTGSVMQANLIKRHHTALPERWLPCAQGMIALSLIPRLRWRSGTAHIYGG